MLAEDGALVGDARVQDRRRSDGGGSHAVTGFVVEVWLTRYSKVCKGLHRSIESYSPVISWLFRSVWFLEDGVVSQVISDVTGTTAAFGRSYAAYLPYHRRLANRA